MNRRFSNFEFVDVCLSRDNGVPWVKPGKVYPFLENHVFFNVNQVKNRYHTGNQDFKSHTFQGEGAVDMIFPGLHPGLWSARPSA